MKLSFTKGLRDGVPIALGYFSVAFGFGILAVGAGLSTAQAVGISASNLTSAGQVAGLKIIAAEGGYLEMAMTQLVINLRYSLMGLSLSQKLDDRFSTPHRLLAAYGITDEIFAVASAQEGRLSPRYMYGLILISFLGWTLGTLLGASAGHVLPAALTDAMGIMLYAMFLAIFIPPMREKRSVLTVVAVAVCCSLLLEYVFPFVSGGFAVIIAAVIAAAVGALLFPVEDEEEAADA